MRGERPGVHEGDWGIWGANVLAKWGQEWPVDKLSSQIVIEKKHYSAELLTQRGGWRWGEEQDYNGSSCSVLCCPAV